MPESRTSFHGLFSVSEKETHWSDGTGDVRELWGGFCRSIEVDVDSEVSVITLTSVDGSTHTVRLAGARYESGAPGSMTWRVADWHEDIDYGTEKIVYVRPVEKAEDSIEFLGADFSAGRAVMERVHELREINGSYQGGQAPWSEDVVLQATIATQADGSRTCIGLGLYWIMPNNDHEVFLARRVQRSWAESGYGSRWIDQCEEEGFVGPKDLPNLTRVDIPSEHVRFIVRLFDSGVVMPATLFRLFSRANQEPLSVSELPEPISALLRQTASMSNSEPVWHNGGWDRNRVHLAKAMLTSDKVMAPLGDIIGAADVALRSYETREPPVLLELDSSSGTISEHQRDLLWQELEASLARQLASSQGSGYVGISMTSTQTSDLWQEGRPDEWVIDFSWHNSPNDTHVSFDVYPAEGMCDGSCRRAKWHYTFCQPFESEVEDFLDSAFQQHELDQRGWDSWSYPLEKSQNDPEIVARLMVSVPKWALAWEPDIRVKVVT